MRPSVSRRTLALWFPELPLDRWRRREDPCLWGPFAVTRKTGNVERVVCANDHARKARVQPGDTVADAYAGCPDLLTEPQDNIREARLLGALHIWADRYSPRIALDPPNGLLLDVTGCAHLFEGEQQMAELILRETEDLTVVTRIGIASTLRAARGFARHGTSTITITDPDREHAQVDGLPVAALDLKTSIETDLRRLGVTTIGELRRFKSAELARRFSVHLTSALDELRGHTHDAVVPSAVVPTFAANMTLPEPIGRLEDVTGILERLAERVCQKLCDKGYTARGFRLTVRCVDTGDHHLSVGFASPTRTVTPILRQFARPLDQLKIEFGADWMRLLALDTGLFNPHQIEAGNAAQAQQEAVDQTLTTLGNRIGFDRLHTPRPGPGHTPEREMMFAPAVDALDWTPPTDLITYPRPEIAFAPERVRVDSPGRAPYAFTWRRDSYRVVTVKGPERISPVNWDDPNTKFEARVRDYWRARTECGRLFWLMVFPKHPDDGCYICGEFLREPRLSLLRA
ncbi:hypothetical protein [uncultured Algimonas sp.]|uniref:Y-family DNA polymerase n=1 Tax=uncultured Algimonas sp. TaxID=1547920 RepID=UPI00344BCB86